MKPALFVAVRGWQPEAWAERLRALLPGRAVLAADRRGIFAGPDSALIDVRYAIVWKPLQETIDRLKQLDVLFSAGAGVDHIFSLTRLPEVPIVRIVDRDLTSRMTEYVVWQVLDHLRRGATYRRHQAEHLWDELEQPAARAVTVGIMGMGVMGSDAARVLLRLGFRVRGWSRSGSSVGGVESFAGKDRLDAFLGGTDILVSLLPLTPETRELIDLPLLKKLRRDGPLGGPVLINAGRGGSQVEADIVTALNDGTLIGASLDVFSTEPLAAESPLWTFPNVTVTPHLAAVSDPVTIVEGIAAQVEAFERGEPLKNLVDPARGY